MLQKKLLLTKLFIFGLTLLTVQAQTHQVQGEIVTVHQQAIPFATVGILKAEDSTLIKAAVTDDNGKFSFNNIENGTYRVMVNSMGFGQYYSSTFQVAGQDKQLATITLQEKEGLLEEVEVTAQKPLVEVLSDKMVFNVQDNIAATGTSAFELLRKVPGVIMDNNNQLLVEGKTGVLIFINGKQSFLEGDDLNNFLQSLQASDIEAIEVITQPSSKYDAAGAAGILNIRLKKDKGLGTNGTVNVGYSQWDNVRYNSALSVNNRTKYTNTFLNYSNRFGATNNFIDLYRLQNDFIFDAQSEGIRDVNTHNVRMGSDWFTSDKSTFGVLFSGNFGNTRANTDSNTPILDRGTGNLLQLLVAESNALSTYSNMLGNLNYRFEDTLGRSFNVDVDYGAYSRTRNNEQPNFYFGGDNALQSQFIYDMDTPTDIRIFTFKSDYEQPFWKGKLGTGVKVSVINTDNTFDFYEVIEDERILDEDRSNTFAYEEGIYAAYLNFSRKWKKLDVQVGLRAEQTISDGQLTSTQIENNQRVERRYLNWFPSGGLTYRLNRNNSFALLYSKRIQRPNYQSLNPFEMQLDELNFSRGNAFLQPQYIDNVKLTHTYKYVLNTSISYSFVQDFFAQVTQREDERRSVLQTQNVANQEVWNISISSPVDITKWWNAFVSLNAYHSRFTAQNEAFTPLSRSTLSLYAQNTFTLPKNYQVEISGWYSSPSIWGGTYLTESLGSLNIALQKKLLDEKLSIRVSMSDVLFTSPWRGDTEYDGVLIQGNGGWESRQVRANLSYRFGNKQVKSARKRKTAAEEEIDRAN